MHAVRYHGPGLPFKLEEVPIPEPGPEEVQVQVKAAALCHTELHFADGTLNLGVAPITMGHEAVGVITKVGTQVDASRVGERVIVYYYQGCGACRHCLHKEGNQQLCGSLKGQHGFVSDGGLAGYLVTPSGNALLLPESIPFEIAAPIGCGVTTAVHSSKLADVQEAEWCVVYGTNGVGLHLLQLLRHRGAKVIAIGRSKAKLDKAKELGAEAVVDASTEDVAGAVRTITSGDGADVIFECVGNRTTIDTCVGWGGMLGKRGRLVFIGYTNGEAHEFRLHPIPMIVFEQKIMGSVGATFGDLKESVDLVAQGIVKPVIDQTVALKDFQKGLDRIASSEGVGKIVVTDFGGP